MIPRRCDLQAAPIFQKAVRGPAAEMKRRARAAYRRFAKDPALEGLKFKPLKSLSSYWSVRVSEDYRAIGARIEPDKIVWIFIGSHADYDKLIARLKG